MVEPVKVYSLNLMICRKSSSRRSSKRSTLATCHGSPDPYGKQIDGMGGATSSTSKTVILAKSTQPDHDVDYLFGQVSIDQPFVDWSGNCGNLTAAVGSLRFRMAWLMPIVFLKMASVLFEFGKNIQNHYCACTYHQWPSSRNRGL